MLDCAENPIRVCLIMGQSNAWGRYNQGYLTGDDKQLLEPFSGAKIWETLLTKSGKKSYTLDWDSIRPRLVDNRFGPELTLAREMASVFTDLRWIKITAPGTSMKQLAPSDNSGVFSAMRNALSEALSALPDNVECEKLFWIHGEADRRTPNSSEYVLHFNELVAFINSVFSVNEVVISPLSESVTTTTLNAEPHAPHAAMINSALRQAGFTLADSTDALALKDGCHYTAQSNLELGRMLARAALQQ